MWIAIDAGNTKIKWALFDNCTPMNFGVVNRISPSNLFAKAVHNREVWLAAANDSGMCAAVGGAQSVVMVKTQRYACGITNRYRPPSALGVDRWLALLSVRRTYRRAIVVSAGTAVTIDGFDADGIFHGGLILPGLFSMLLGVSGATSLPEIHPENIPLLADTPPNTTQSGLLGGAALAVVGAVQYFRRRFFPSAPIILTGGDASKLLPFLPTAKHVPNLVLLGIARLREESRR